MSRGSWILFAWGISFACAAARADEAELHGIPYKPDPPPAVDGRLEEWASVPNPSIINTRAQVAHGGKAWTSAKDLSAKVWLAWREEYLYLAADVTDDHHVQTGRDRNMWRGDHVELYLDATPDVDADRNTWGPGQVHLGLSPGNFQRTGDRLSDLAPEAVVFTPEGSRAEGVLVASQKTETGYSLEAAIPWTLLGRLAKRPGLKAQIGMPLGFEVGISDTDGPEPAQEKMMTILTKPWGHVRNRLIAAALAPSDGHAPAIVRGVDLAKGFELAPQKKTELAFKGLIAPAGRESVLALKARLDTPRAAGYTRGIRLSLNGTVVDPCRLLNRQREEARVDGRMMTPSAGESLNVCYAPDFDAPDRHPTYALSSGAKLCQFDLRVTDLLREGDNLLVIESVVTPETKRTVVVADVRLEIRTPPQPKAKRPAPTGPLDIFAPAQRHKVEYQLTQLPEAALELVLGGERFRIESEFSTPKPGWVKSANEYFDHRRRVEQLDEAIVVHDTFTNRTGANLPLMQRHRVLMPGRLKKVWLAGLSPAGLVGSSSDSAHPSVYGTTEKVGVGVLAVDDVSQVHVANFSDEDQIGWADNQRVLKPGATHEVQWTIVPTARPDYWAMVNAVRRLRDVNFTLEGSFAFLRAYPKKLTGTWSDQQFVDFIRYKDAHFLCDNYGCSTYKGRFPHGTAFQGLDYSFFRQHVARMRNLAPDSKHLMYFHCFLDVLDEAPERYADARLLRVDGTQADYGKPYDRIFVPTDANAFGRDVAKNVDLILGSPPQGFGCEGVYWDEFEYSRYQYHYDDFRTSATGLPWDGVSADIDPKTMKIARLKCSVTLLSQPFRLALAQRILKDHRLVANGQPHTQTMTKLHFPRFVETGSISHCAATHLYSPLALGDHLTERSEADAYRVMLRALDFGCLYYWYNDVTVIPTHPHLTHWMFPITPIELHEGYLVGRERMVTNRSGLFGWGDASRHEVHVFDDQGREVPAFQAPTVVREGATFTELRLPEDYSAAIVRKP